MRDHGSEGPSGFGGSHGPWKDYEHEPAYSDSSPSPTPELTLGKWPVILGVAALAVLCLLSLYLTGVLRL